MSRLGGEKVLAEVELLRMDSVPSMSPVHVLVDLNLKTQLAYSLVRNGTRQRTFEIGK